MAHFQRAVGAAVILNTVIVVGEAVAGLHANSLSLLVDSVHNFSDELALLCLYLAFFLPAYLGRQSQRVANVLNSLGLITLCGVAIAQAVVRFQHPPQVSGVIPMLAGFAAAAANYGVARLLREMASYNATARLAYLHNKGDVVVSLAPVLAGALVFLTGRNQADVLVAVSVAAWLAFSTAREVRTSANELLWPEHVECLHPVPSVDHT
ncbi:MAG: cation transporter [Gammaproteobacteria bacterium]|nr:cation transporter [Gammaproteobacteria bacterium]